MLDFSQGTADKVLIISALIAVLLAIYYGITAQGLSVQEWISKVSKFDNVKIDITDKYVLLN